MDRTNLFKCSKLLSTRSGNDQRACGLIIQRVQSTKKNTPPPRGTKKGIFKVAPEEEDMEDIPPPIKKKRYIFGINQSVSCILIIVVDFQLDPGVATSTL